MYDLPRLDGTGWRAKTGSQLTPVSHIDIISVYLLCLGNFPFHKVKVTFCSYMFSVIFSD